MQADSADASSPRSILKRPGRWMRATHKTQGGPFEVRARLDGDYDVRDVSGDPEPYGRDRVMRVDRSYVEAEFVITPGPRPKR